MLAGKLVPQSIHQEETQHRRKIGILTSTVFQLCQQLAKGFSLPLNWLSDSHNTTCTQEQKPGAFCLWMSVKWQLSPVLGKAHRGLSVLSRKEEHR